MFFRYLLPFLYFSPVLLGDTFSQTIAPAFQKYCIECHGGKKIKGKVDLTKIKSSEDLTADLGQLQNLIDVIDYEEMPPEDELQLNIKYRAKLLASLKGALEQSLAKEKLFAQSLVRRMNRFQYNNAIVDLFELNRYVFSLPEKMLKENKPYFDPASGKMPDKVFVGSRPLGKSQMIEPTFESIGPFPQDLRAEHGYDNRGTHLSLSPFLMEQFLNLARKIVYNNDFHRGTVGLWNDLFVPPKDDLDLKNHLEKTLSVFLKKAFRRPVESHVLTRYVEYVKSRISRGSTYENAMKELSIAVISSPKFLYLYDSASETSHSTQLDPFDLASRLSFFLWGSIPDKTLLELAEKGTLSNPEILEEQVDRMLNHKKLKRFADSFPTQWLQLENIISSIPNKKKYPRFYASRYRASMHMMLEPLLLFESILIENRSIIDLLDPDYTYKSGFLSTWDKNYNIPTSEKTKKNRFEVSSISFERQTITDRRNGGIITNPAILTMTSGSEETHPITRGAWITTVVFNNPPEPPPADVPPLPKKPIEGEEKLTLRERLNAHRERADCAGCHEKIDTLGFALENFDAVGYWRETYPNGRKVDMQGTIFRKHSFNDIYEFKDALVKEKDRYTRGLAGHLLSFALARELDATDTPSIDQITEQTIQKEYRLRDMIKAVIFSESFNMKTTSKSLAQHTNSSLK